LKRVAELLGLGALLERKPSQLSGGQQQRVALGRAIIAEAPVCLMDEPLSNLDAQLRGEMRREIRSLQRRLGITMVYVTHDQTEAMTMADRIVLMRDGRIEQQGAPLDLYERPATQYVAGFLGSPAMNFIPAQLVAEGGGLAVRLADATLLALPAPRSDRYAAQRDRAVTLGVRPEHIGRAREFDARAGLARCTASVRLVQPTGSRTYGTLELAGHQVIAELQAHDVPKVHERVELSVDMNRALLIDPQTEAVL
jgi:multiple sugar transport system ATP-binding protein